MNGGISKVELGYRTIGTPAIERHDDEVADRGHPEAHREGSIRRQSDVIVDCRRLVVRGIENVLARFSDGSGRRDVDLDRDDVGDRSGASLENEPRVGGEEGRHAAVRKRDALTKRLVLTTLRDRTGLTGLAVRGRRGAAPPLFMRDSLRCVHNTEKLSPCGRGADDPTRLCMWGRPRVL